MKSTLVSSTCLAVGLSPLAAQQPEFAPPVRLKGGGEYVKVEAPGYASPCWADADGDGKPDLIVGQFHKGKMKVYRGLGKAGLAAGEWLVDAEGNVAEVPGVW